MQICSAQFLWGSGVGDDDKSSREAVFGCASGNIRFASIAGSCSYPERLNEGLRDSPELNLGEGGCKVLTVG